MSSYLFLGLRTVFTSLTHAVTQKHQIWSKCQAQSVWFALRSGHGLSRTIFFILEHKVVESAPWQCVDIGNKIDERFVSDHCKETEGAAMAPQRVILMSCGSYNPPTNMHLRMFEIARDHLHKMGTHIVVGGIISPVHDGYDKKDLASSSHRCAMLRLALQNSDWIRLSTWETRQNCWTKTRLSLQYHQNLLNSILFDTNETKNQIQIEDMEWIPENIRNSTDCTPIQIKLLCGADLLESFGIPGVWMEEDIQAIIGQHGLVVITREGSNPNKFIYDSDILSQYMHNICIVTEWISNEISSTRIRRALRRGESVRYLMQDSVIDYVYQHGIYEAKTVPATIKLELNTPNGNNYLTIVDPKCQSTFLTPSPSDVTMDSPTTIEILSIDVPDTAVLHRNVQNATFTSMAALAAVETSNVPDEKLAATSAFPINCTAANAVENSNIPMKLSVYPGQAKQIIATKNGLSQILDEVGFRDGVTASNFNPAPIDNNSICLPTADVSLTKDCQAASSHICSDATAVANSKCDKNLQLDNVNHKIEDSGNTNEMIIQAIAVDKVSSICDDNNDSDNNRDVEKCQKIKPEEPVMIDKTTDDKFENFNASRGQSVLDSTATHEKKMQLIMENSSKVNDTMESIVDTDHQAQQSDNHTSVESQTKKLVDQQEPTPYEPCDILDSVTYEIDGKYRKSVVNSRKSPRRIKGGQIHVVDTDDIDYEPKDEDARLKTKHSSIRRTRNSGKKKEKVSWIVGAQKETNEPVMQNFAEQTDKHFVSQQRISSKGSLDSVIRGNNEQKKISIRKGGRLTESSCTRKTKSCESIMRNLELTPKSHFLKEQPYGVDNDASTQQKNNVHRTMTLYEQSWYDKKAKSDILSNELCSICCSSTNDLKEGTEESSSNQDIFYTFRSTCSSGVDEDSTECDICSSWNLQKSTEISDLVPRILELTSSSPEGPVCEICEICDETGLRFDNRSSSCNFETGVDVESDNLQRFDIIATTDPCINDEDVCFQSGSCCFQNGTNSVNEKTQISVTNEVGSISNECKRPSIEITATGKIEAEYILPKDNITVLSSELKKDSRKNVPLFRKKSDDTICAAITSRDKRRYFSADNLRSNKFVVKNDGKFILSSNTKLIGSADNIRIEKRSIRSKSLQRMTDKVQFDHSLTDNINSPIESVEKQNQTIVYEDNLFETTRDSDTVKMILTKRGIKVISEKETAL